MPANSPEELAAERLADDLDLQSHLVALGLKSLEEYTSWCARHGFSVRVDKSWRDRCRERYFAARDGIRDRLARKKRELRKPGRVIERIFSGELSEQDLTQPHLALVAKIAGTITDGAARDAFCHLLRHVERSSRLLSTRPAVPRRGIIDGNTYIDGLFALALNRGHWIRPLQSWQPRSRNPRRQFSTLAAHLLAQFAVPAFLDSVWFLGTTDEAKQQQAWYRAMAAGRSPRSLDLPIPLTRRMAHHFLQAPCDYSIDDAIRYGQVMGLGGSVRQVRAILGSRIGADFTNNDFWTTVIRWMIANPMFDPALVGPLIDYIQRQKFDPQEFAAGDGVELRPAQPGFSMQGRTAASLLRQMRRWHAGLRKQPAKPPLEWCESGFGGLEWSEGTRGSGNHRHWAIVELLSRQELYAEGRTLRHCVASYDSSCAFGRSSIWSLAVERDAGRSRRVLTIEVSNASRTICQVRGKANRLPSQKEMGIVHRWAAQQGLRVASHVACC